MRFQCIGYVGCGLVLWLLSGSFGAYAQITLDGTMGPRGSLQGPDYQIPANLGQQHGGNLFHSFGQFNVYTGQSATFSGPNSVQNIISRVTGGSSSSIDGTLRSTIPGANLFLLNPAGVLFGPNAKLDVSGSFHVSTADYLRLGENDRFYVDPAKTSVLSVAPVTAFGFLSQAPAPITVQGSFLRVPQGKTLSLIGGDLTLTNATLYAPAGRINLASVGSAGEVIPTAADLGMQDFGKQGTITIRHPSATRLQVNLGQPFGWVPLGDVDTSGTAGGAIFIRGGRFTVDKSTVNANTTGSGSGGGIDVRVKELEVTRDGELRADNYGSGSGPGIRVEAETISLDNGGFMAARARGAGSGGDITLLAGKVVNIGGPSSNTTMVVAGSLATGNGGTLRISTPELNLVDGGMIAGISYSQGRGADVVLNVDRLTLSSDGIIYLPARGTGRGGNLTITANSLTLNSGGNIDVSTRASGRGGDLTITANDVKISGSGQYPSGLYMISYGAGDAGKLVLSTKGVLAIDNGGVIKGDSNPNATGRGADISIDADRLELAGGGSIDVNTFGAGQGGNLTVAARRDITITGNAGAHHISGLYGQSSGSGNAGTITVTTPNLMLSDGGTISGTTYAGGKGADISIAVDRLTLTGGLDPTLGGTAVSSGTLGSGRGGDITISASQSVTLDGQSGFLGSHITAGGSAVGSTAGPAGNIRLSTPSLQLTRNAAIDAGTVDGPAGAIDLTVDRLEISGGGIDASTQRNGQAGRINITADDNVTVAGIPAGPTKYIPGQISSAGNAGEISITAPNLVVTAGGRIGATATGDNTPPGTSGTIRLQGDRIQILNGGYVATTSSGPAKAGDINVTAKLLEVGNGGHIEAGTTGTGDGGGIVLQVDRLVLSNGGQIRSDTKGPGQGGEIQVTAAEAVTIAGAGADTQPAGLSTNSYMPATGRAGAIRITAPVVELNEGGAITNATTGTGAGGAIELNVDRLVVTPGAYVAVDTAEGSGRGGDMRISARDSVSISGVVSGGSIRSSGNGGTIQITAPLVNLHDGGIIKNTTSGAGDAGAIELQVDRLVLTGGSMIATDTSGGSGRGGTIRVNATGSVTVSGQVQKGLYSTLQANSRAPATGSGGEIQVTAPVVELSDGGYILSATTGTGDGGHIELQVDRLLLNGGGSLTATTFGSGRGGEINVTAKETINLTGGNDRGPSGIYARSRAPATGNAGNITLTTDRLTLNEGTTITAESEQTSGGNILINARDTRLYKSSTITSSVQGNEQSDGGNVTLNGDKLIVYQGGKITARANQGRGGRITINENVFLYEAPRAIPDVLDASSQVAGNQGVVTINAQDLNLNSTLVPLPATYLDASKLLSNRCTSPQAGGRSSFVVRGRGAVPPGPEGPTPALARECLAAIPVTAGSMPLERAATSNK